MTAEEIRRHVDAGKPAMVYFSRAPVAPQSLDQGQYSQLTEFKNLCKTQGLIEEYANLPEFSEKFHRKIHLKVRDNEYLASIIGSGPSTPDHSSYSGDALATALRNHTELSAKAQFDLSEEARKLLIGAAKDKNGGIVSVRDNGGQSIQTDGINFTHSGDRRSIARWEAALERLLLNDLIMDRGYKNEIFELTAKGF